MIAENQNERYIDQLQDIVSSYNSKEHSSIGISPSEVNSSNERLVWYMQYWPKKVHQKLRKYKYEIGDLVRISYLRKAFTKGSADYQFTGEVFRVISRTRRDGIPVFKLADMAGENLKGQLYSDELVKVAPKEMWLGEKVLRRRHRRGHPPESLVKFLHFPDKFNQWVESSSVVDI